MIDRDTAARLGVTPQAIDDALYDAFGQRQVSTIYTQLNQYHVVHGGRAASSGRARTRSSDVYVSAPTGAQVPLSRVRALRARQHAARRQPPGPVPGDHALVQPRARASSLGDAVDAIERRRARASACPPTIHGSFQGTAQAFQASLANQPLLILAALVAVYIVLGMLYESCIHPITILSTLPSAGVGRAARAAAVQARI